MKDRYFDLVEQTYFFPQDEFALAGDSLLFHGIDLLGLVEKYGSPLKFTYLPKISENINRAKTWFSTAMKEQSYEGAYHYCYCTKSSHFRYVLEEALKNDIHIETSSAFDIDIFESLRATKRVSDDTMVVCNGFKCNHYIHKIANLIRSGHKNCIPVLDNFKELDELRVAIGGPFQIGIRIASEEEPKFEFYTSRLGIGYKDILPFYKERIQGVPHVELKMLHFFINTGIKDTAYYWNELHKSIRVYIALRRLCPTLSGFNIGGGLPIKNSLTFEFDYQEVISEIINQIRLACKEAQVPVPDIYTEFGSFTVGESGGAIFKVLEQKRQNDRERWNMIDSSFITTLPDTWAISKRFLMLPVNRWFDRYERVLLGGLTCDSDDYYNSEQHVNAIFLPRFDSHKSLYIGFFNTGSYQETIGGFGGLKHCLIPGPKHIIIDRNESGEVVTEIFAKEQTAEDMLHLLGYA